MLKVQFQKPQQRELSEKTIRRKTTTQHYILQTYPTLQHSTHPTNKKHLHSPSVPQNIPKRTDNWVPPKQPSTPAAAKDFFRMDLAGSKVGAMFGKGIYLAENAARSAGAKAGSFGGLSGGKLVGWLVGMGWNGLGQGAPDFP